MGDVQHLLSVQNALGESPLWDAANAVLYWCDISLRQIFRYLPHSGVVEDFQIDCMPGCLGLTTEQGLILGTSNGFAYYDFNTLQLLDGNIAYKPQARINDGKVDRSGRFWAGTASDQPVNHLYRLDPDGTVNIHESGIIISNGIGWSPDNKTMYYSDSGGAGIVYAYDFDSLSGALSNRRVFLPPTGTSAVVDGLTVDSEGRIWCAYWDGWKIGCFSPEGVLLHEIQMPVQRPTSCMFGGPDLKTLYITSARVDTSGQPLAGDLFCIQTDVAGLPETRFVLPSSISTG
jgi:sugar lactone lactonase YvrE